MNSGDSILNYKNQVVIEYPVPGILTPYHSKYNPIERCWGILEEHWNGEILDSISKTVNWACTMTWKGIKPVVTLLEKSYKKGIRLTKKEMKPYENRIQRSNTLPKWDVLIESRVG